MRNTKLPDIKSMTTELPSVIPLDQVDLAGLRKELAPPNLSKGKGEESDALLRGGLLDEALVLLRGAETALKTPSNRNEALEPVLRAISQIVKDLEKPQRAAFELPLIRKLDALTKTLLSPDYSTPGLAADTLPLLLEARRHLASSKVLSDTPRLTADGLMRSAVYYMDDGVLSSVRKQRGFDPVKCDLLVIGGGPAGLSAAFHAGRLGIDTVALDESFFVSSLSDARALPVHLMRTNSGGSSLFRQGIVPDEVSASLDMPRFMDTHPLRDLAVKGRLAAEKIEGRMFPEELPGVSDDHHRATPVTRGEVFGYFLEVARKAAEFRSVFLSEQSAVQEITWDAAAGRFHIQSAAGHKLSPRFVVMASGAVGVEAEASRSIPLLKDLAQEKPEAYLFIESERDLQLQRHDLLSSKKQPIFSEALLGQHELREMIQRLPPRSELAVIGSGESAAKGVLALIELNPHIRVSLFTKGALEPSQGQGPPFGGFKDSALTAIEDPDFGKLSLEILREYFGTPITPESMHQLLDLVHQRQVRIFELGDRFDSAAVQLHSQTTAGGTVTEVHLRGDRQDLVAALDQQAREWQKAGLLQPKRSLIEVEATRKLATITGPIMMAGGFDREKLFAQNPLMQQLEAQGQIATSKAQGGSNLTLSLDRAQGLFSSKNQNLAFSGAVIQNSSLDGVFGGEGVRSYLLVSAIAQKLGKSLPGSGAAPVKVLASGKSLVKPDPEMHSVRENSEYPPSDRFPGNPHLEQIAKREQQGKKLTPAEIILLARGDQLYQRLRQVLRANEVSPF